MGTNPDTNSMEIIKFIDNYQLWFFFITTIIISWLLNPVISMLYGVLIAFLLLLITNGWDGIWGLASGLLKWTADLRWYLFVIFITIIIDILAITMAIGLLGHMMINPMSLFNLAIRGILIRPIYLIIILLSTIGTALEFGYAMPILLKRHTPLASGLIMGLVSFLAAANQIFIIGVNNPYGAPGFIVQIAITLIPFVFMLVWLFDKTQGSLPLVLICLLFYNVYNLGLISEMYPIIITIGCIYIITAILLIAADKNYFLKRRPIGI